MDDVYDIGVPHPSKLAVTPPNSSVSVMVMLAAMGLMAGCDWFLSQKQQNTNMALKENKSESPYSTKIIFQHLSYQSQFYPKKMAICSERKHEGDT